MRRASVWVSPSSVSGRRAPTRGSSFASSAISSSDRRSASGATTISAMSMAGLSTGRGEAARQPDRKRYTDPVVSERDPQKTLIGAARARAGAMLDAGGGGMAASRAMCEALDELCRSVLPPELPAGLSVVATGGWGRCEMAPYSDIDVLFLCAEEPGDAARALADRVLYPLWDGGVEVGHAVRSIPEAAALARDDLATLSALLDARTLAGDPRLLAELGKQLAHGHPNVYVR